jgi:patatin-like phospholipase/acyl hydrolase
MSNENTHIFRILSLDGGGAKGFYTLGILREVEAMLPRSIHETFDLIFGTSTGSIIAALLSLGYSVENIHQLYCNNVPTIMKAKSRRGKSEALKAVGQKIFNDVGFDQVRTGIGIVSTKWQLETPMIFKSRHTQAHGRTATFVPGFGCTIAEAVEASCSAFPFFERKTVTTANGDVVELFDGGYCANNPTLYAIADATMALGHAPSNCRVLSLGCGQYPEPQRGVIARMKRNFLPVQLLQKTLEVNTASMDQLRALLFSAIPTIRISDTFDKPEMATDMFEHDIKKLNLLRQQGAESFARREKEIRQLLLDEER